MWEFNIVVGIASTLWAGRSRVQMSVRARNFSILQNVQTGSEAKSVSPFNAFRVFFSMEIKRPPSSTDVTHEWSYTATPPIHHRQDREASTNYRRRLYKLTFSDQATQSPLTGGPEIFFFLPGSKTRSRRPCPYLPSWRGQ
jgi:hypothetical protein